jgi:tetratricopeptide (TPR) repeat protein
VKGKRELVQAYLVRRAKPRPFRSVARGVAGVETRTVGRDQEAHSLQQAYLHAFSSHGLVWAQLLGEPGIGKSRLLEDLTDWIDLREETTRLMRARAFPDDTNQPFALVRRLWFDRFQIAEDIPLEQAEARWVERFTEFYGRGDCEEAAHALGLLVGLPFENSPYIKAMRSDPTQVKGRAFVVSRELVRAIRQQNLVVLLLEDLQWTDLASWDYLMQVFFDKSQATQANGIFILGAARPEWHPPKILLDLFASSLSMPERSDPWGILLDLAPLTDQAVRELALELLQRVPKVPQQVVDLLVERSEGVPYFTEEMVNWFIDHGILDTQGEQWQIFPERLKEQPLPATLQHLLLTRLSALSPTERAALQRGAIFGRRFWSGGVEALGNPAGAEVFGHLQPRGFVEAQPESAFQGETEWSFHQNMLHEVTYESVLKRERLALHKVAAGWLERQARNAGRLDEFAGLLGDHYQRAGELDIAVDWFMMAGRRALTQGAPREAVSYYTQALDMLPPVDRERRWNALLGRENAFNVLGEAEPRKADLDAILDLAQSFEDDNYLAEAYLLMAGFSTQMGDDRITRKYAREAYEASKRCGNVGVEAKALSLIAMATEFKPEEIQPALHNIEEALRLARSLEDKSILAMVLFRAGIIDTAIGDLAGGILEQVEQVELHHQLGNRAMEAVGLGNLAGNYSRLGLFKQARSVLEQSRVINESLGAQRGYAYDLIGLGELSWKSGDLRTARHVYEQAYL